LPIGHAIITPKQYFRASNELIVLALVLCWTITLVFYPEQAINHPARAYTGHFNPCMGWDFPPSSYVAVLLCGYDVSLAWRYAELEGIRTKLLDTDGRTTLAERFATVSALMHGVASLLWLLLWSIGPTDNRWVTHTIIFVAAVSLRYICALGNYLECRFGGLRARELVKTHHTAFIAAYGFVTLILLPTPYFYNFAIYMYDGRVGVDPPLPPVIIQSTDIIWMVCLVLSSRFAIPEPPILVTRKIVDFGSKIVLDVEEDEESSFTRASETIKLVEVVV